VTLVAVARAATGTLVPFNPLAPAAGLVVAVAALTGAAVMIPCYVISAASLRLPPDERGSVPDMKIVVIGGGVSGLTCAVALLEASRGGAEVAVLTAGAPAGTVSAVAGAMLGPVFGSGDARSLAWERHSDAVFRKLAGDPATGVRLVRGRLLAAPELGPGLPPWVEHAGLPGLAGGPGPGPRRPDRAARRHQRGRDRR
jgi:hypothetical protein